MIAGVGTDIIEISRIRKVLQHHPDKFLYRLFTEDERKYCLKRKDPAIHIAGLFAGKEAVAKSLGTGFIKNIGWKDIEIAHDAAGKPVVVFSFHLQSLFPSQTIQLSISHTHEHAIAFAVREQL